MNKVVDNPIVQISLQAKATLDELAAKEGKPVEAVLDAAIEEYRRDVFFSELNAGFERLRADPEAWADYQAESDSWHRLCDTPDSK